MILEWTTLSTNVSAASLSSQSSTSVACTTWLPSQNTCSKTEKELYELWKENVKLLQEPLIFAFVSLQWTTVMSNFCSPVKSQRFYSIAYRRCKTLTRSHPAEKMHKSLDGSRTVTHQARKHVFLTVMLDKNMPEDARKLETAKPYLC